MRLEDVTHFASDHTQPIQVEGREPDLDRAGIVEARVGLEVDVEALREWFQSLDALGSLEESRRARDQQVQAGKPTRIDFVDQLPKGVEALVAHVATGPLDRLDLIQHEQQTGLTRITQDRQDPLEEIERAEMVDVALDACEPFRAGGDVRLPGEPSKDTVGRGVVRLGIGLPIFSVPQSRTCP